MPLSELIVRQAHKSNVRWFTYPFIPPTTFSGFLHSVIFKDNLNNFIERNNGITRRIEDICGDAYSLGAYPPVANEKIKVCEHYRQHFDKQFNYESLCWTSEQNKKLAVVEYFWANVLRGFVISEHKNILREIRKGVDGRVARIGKKGSVQIVGSKLYSLNLEKTGGVEWCSTIAPVETVTEFAIDSTIYIVPISSQKNEGNGNRTPQWKLQGVMFGVKISPPYYKDPLTKTVFPVEIVKLVKGI
jgi:hypothetical protein